MSLVGTFEMCRQAQRMSAYLGRPEWAAGGRIDAFDPQQTFGF